MALAATVVLFLRSTLRAGLHALSRGLMKATNLVGAMIAAAVVVAGCSSGESADRSELSTRREATTTTTLTRPTTTTNPYASFTADQQAFLAAVDSEGLLRPDVYMDQYVFVVNRAGFLCEDARNGVPAGNNSTGKTPAEVVQGALETDPQYDPDGRFVRIAELTFEYVCRDVADLVAQVRGGDVPEAPALTEFSDGLFKVGEEIEPGIYQTELSVSDCYWERVDESGNTIDNNFIVGAPQARVTVSSSDFGFTSRGCGSWKKVG